jgi:hypothetical protein
MNGATKNSSPPPSAASALDFNNKPCGHFELDEDDPCVICHDDMKSPIDTVTLECGHKYHNSVSLILEEFKCRAFSSANGRFALTGNVIHFFQ